MPTATATLTRHSYASQIPVKSTIMSNGTAASSPDPSTPALTQSPSLDTLRSLYNRAARAFVLRDISLTYSLIQSAFGILKPPTALADSLADQRRKWDILRITFESTVYLSPPSQDTLPESLRANLSETPQALATSTYSRSLTLFNPYVTNNSSASVLNAAFLPVQVLTTLIYFTLKINAPGVGRTMIEDWLARREPRYAPGGQDAGDGYDKVLDLYCLHILPKLEEWDYAQEFLDYENELSAARREELKSTLKALHTQAMESKQAQRPMTSLLPSNSSTPRPHSPAPSTSSSSSSLSTTSTHTVVPATVKGNNRPSASPSRNNTHARIPSSSASCSSTATPRGRHAQLSSTTTSTSNNTDDGPRSTSRTHSSTSSTFESLSRSRNGHATALISEPSTSSSHPPSTYALIKAYARPYLTSKRTTTFLFVFVLVPLISFLFRVRRKRLEVAAASAAASAGSIGAATAVRNADLVRRRLHSGGAMAGDVGMFGRAWGEVVRVVGDTVKMAGSGLV